MPNNSRIHAIAKVPQSPLVSVVPSSASNAGVQRRLFCRRYPFTDGN
jgi:hypothetical protein